MTTTVTRWNDVEKHLREQAYFTMDSDPRVLLEHDGGPLSLDADLFCARMMGMDDELVTDMWISRPEPYLLMPIAPSFRKMMAEVDEPPSPSLNTARYVLQSGWVIQTVSATLAFPPEGVRPRPDHTVRVAYLRYRRRLYSTSASNVTFACAICAEEILHAWLHRTEEADDTEGWEVRRVQF